MDVANYCIPREKSPEELRRCVDGSSDTFTKLLEELRCAHSAEIVLLRTRVAELQNKLLQGSTISYTSPFDSVSASETSIRKWGKDGVKNKYESDSKSNEEVQDESAKQYESTKRKETLRSCVGGQSLLSLMGQKADKVAMLRLPFDPRPRVSKRTTSFEREDGNFATFLRVRRRTRRVVRSAGWELCCSGLIVCNSLFMAVHVQYDGMTLGRKLGYPGFANKADKYAFADSCFGISDMAFGLIFCLEAAIKIFALMGDYFADFFNLLDFGACVAFLVETGTQSFLPMQSYTVRLLRMVRIVRLVRLVRALETFDALYLMTIAIRGSISILAWALMLLLFFQMTIALFMTQIFHSTYFKDNHSSSDRLLLFEYFGTFSRSLLSVFEMTLANWPTVTRILVEKVSEWFIVLCLVHKLTIGFAVLSVINGVFMQETFKVAATDDNIMMRTKKRAAEMHSKKMQILFDTLDISNDGELDFEEFQLIAQHPDVQTWLASMEIYSDDLPTLFSLIDGDGDGVITPQELINNTSRLRGNARSIDLLMLRKQIEGSRNVAKRSPASKAYHSHSELDPRSNSELATVDPQQWHSELATVELASRPRKMII